MGRIINIGKIYSIQDLNTPSQKLHSNYRDRVKIVVIDDEDFIRLPHSKNWERILKHNIEKLLH